MPKFFVILGNVGRLCLCSGCNLLCRSGWSARQLPSLTNAHFFKEMCIFVFLSIFRCNRIHNLNCWTRHSHYTKLKKMITLSSSRFHPETIPLAFFFNSPSLHLPQLFSILIPQQDLGLKRKIGFYVKGIVLPFPDWFEEFLCIFINTKEILHLKRKH